ncbi:MAG TPA: primosomal replication protein PriC [Arsenophonus sp.]
MAQSTSITPRFDQQLFHRKNHQLSDYLFEIKHYFNQLKNEAITSSSEQVTFLTEKIVAQISAITRKSAIQTLKLT